MKKTKLVVSMLAAFCGIGAAISINAHAFTPSNAIAYDWINWSDQILLYNMTQEEVQDMCAPAGFVCLRARQNVSVYTTGTLPW